MEKITKHHTEMTFSRSFQLLESCKAFMRKRELYESQISGHVTLLLDPEAVLLCTIAGMSTSLGAALVFLIKVTSHKMRDALVRTYAGIMLSVTVKSVPKALGSNQENFVQVIVGIAFGAAATFVVDIIFLTFMAF